jgi:uncharacterized membrane protein YjjP (DUF1212 family)
LRGDGGVQGITEALAAKRALDVAILAGDIMLSNGAETYRVEDTMRRMLNCMGFLDAETFVTATGIFASLGDDDASTRIKRVKNRTQNMAKVARVNSLSRRLSEGLITIKEAEGELVEIRCLPSYKLPLRSFAAGISCFSFCWLCGGGWADCFISMVIGAPVYLFFDLLIRKTSSFLANIMCGAAISLFAAFAVDIGLGSDMGNIIIGAVMPFVPGVAMTNGLRDIAEGDFISGTSRMMEALLAGGALAVGAGAVIGLWMMVMGGDML